VPENGIVAKWDFGQILKKTTFRALAQLERFLFQQSPRSTVVHTLESATNGSNVSLLYAERHMNLSSTSVIATFPIQHFNWTRGSQQSLPFSLLKNQGTVWISDTSEDMQPLVTSVYTYDYTESLGARSYARL
jgi:hypothetical protein